MAAQRESVHRHGPGGGRNRGSAGHGGNGKAGQHGSRASARHHGSHRARTGAAGGGRTPPLPLSLRAPISGVPGLFIEALDVPPFLLPIYQAAGIAYGVPWQVLAAINEVETDYGHDLSLSTAGAEGWMQFLPAEWRRWGVDATGSGYMDPSNPADAIFAAARYLKAAGGSAHIRAAVYAYNHSEAYVESVMMRARLLGRLPPDLIGAVTDLAEARFPVHAPSHFSDGFASAPAGAPGPGTLVGSTIYSEPGAPVIAVKDGTVTAIGDSPRLGLHISLTDAAGNTYTYSELGSVASLYPLLAPRMHAASNGGGGRAGARDGSSIGSEADGAPPAGPASAGAQTHSPLSREAIASGFTFGAAPALQSPPPAPEPSPTPAPPAPVTGEHPLKRSFAAGPEHVSLHRLHVGVRVIAGTVLGHLGSGADAHMLFQLRPAGVGSPLIDPKPILDNWVALEETQIFSAAGESPFSLHSPTAGEALIESKGQLQQQVLREKGIAMPRCARAAIEAGRVARPVLATLELLYVSGLTPTVSQLGCGSAAGSSQAGLLAAGSGRALSIGAINGVPIAGHTGAGSVADLAERKLMTLQGTMAPEQIAGPIEYRGAEHAVRLSASSGSIHVAFAAGPAGSPATGGRRAHAAAAAPELTPADWPALMQRLGQIEDPAVPTAPSAGTVADGQAGGGA